MIINVCSANDHMPSCSILAMCAENIATYTKFVCVILYIVLSFQCQSWPILMQGFDMIGIAQVVIDCAK